MIIAKIVQKGQIITLEDVVTTFQYSANLKMQFVIDESYKDCIITGWYRKFWKKEEKYLLDMQEDGTFLLGQDIFENDGTVEFSFALNYQDGKIVHLGVVEYYVKKSFGNANTILPEQQDTWITVVSQAVKLQMQKEWDKDYRPQLEENLNIIEDKTSEIISAAEKVKQDALESSTNARNALESANLAKNSADSAKEAEEKALEFASNAEEFKNSASNLANQANLAKEDARESANNASNSASSALQNANSAKEHLDSAIEKINTFNADYTNKVNSFNSNVENANNTLSVKLEETNTDLDTKITEANSSIDAKVTTATEHANKAKTEADRAVLATDGKLDKNQGVENAGKAMVVGEDGNVVPGSALPDNVYTQEEVDYLLRDKMDKPYYDIAITDDTTIENTLVGIFKMDSIEGNIYQAEESGIVPTPEKPVLIRSKKITVNDEIIELRSLKETTNLFDLQYGRLLFGENNGKPENNGRIINNGTTIVIENTYSIAFYVAKVYLKANTNYFFKADRTKELIEGMEESGNDLNMIGINQNGTFVATLSSGKYKTVSESGYYDIYCYGTIGCKVTYSNLMLIEGSSAPSSYVAATVRDYKIVDHIAKTSKIVRNVIEIDSSDITAGLHVNGDNFISFVFSTSIVDGTTFPQYKLGYSSSFPVESWNGIKDYEMFWIATASMGVSISKDRNITDGSQFVQFLQDNNVKFLVKSKTPTEESIPYLEDDTSEVGLSWQDSTSPSPDIPSEIYEVDEINIKVVNKNLFDLEKAKDKSNWIPSVKQGGYNDFFIKVEKGKKYTISYEPSVSTGLGFYAGIVNSEDITNKNISNWMYYNSASGSINKTIVFTAVSDSISFRCNKTGIDICLENLKNIQLESGENRTTYESHKEISIQHILSKPLRATKDGSVRDAIDIVNKQVTYNMKDVLLNGTQNINAENNNIYNIVMSDVNYIGGIATVFCDKYKGVSYNERNNYNTCICAAIGRILMRNININSALEFKEELTQNPITVLYATNTPTTEPLEDELVQKLKTLKTFSTVTNVFVEGIAKPKLNAKYPKDLALAQQKLETKLLTLQEEVVKNV